MNLFFDKFCNRYGQDAVLVTQEGAVPCPCTSNPEKTPDPKWHRDNPSEPNCNGAGIIANEPANTPIKAFIEPIKGEEVRDTEAGKILATDLKYRGKASVPVFTMGDEDYILYDEKKHKIINPRRWKKGGITVYVEAIMRLL